MGGREEEGVRVVPLQQPDVLQDEFRGILWLLQQVEDVLHFQQLQIPEEGAWMGGREEEGVVYTHMQTQRHIHKHTHTHTHNLHSPHIPCTLYAISHPHTQHHPHSQTYYTEYAPPPTPSFATLPHPLLPSLHSPTHSLLHYTSPPTPSFTTLLRPLPPSLHSPSNSLPLRFLPSGHYAPSSHSPPTLPLPPTQPSLLFLLHLPIYHHYPIPAMIRPG